MEMFKRPLSVAYVCGFLFQLCTYPTAALTFRISPCLVMQTLTSERGVIKIPRLANSAKYPNSQHCQWLILAGRKDARITLTADGYDIEGHQTCSYDYLILYDGETVCAPVLDGPICGTGSEKSWTSTGSSVLVIFHTDPTSSRHAFDIRYEVTNATYLGNRLNGNATFRYEHLLIPVNSIGFTGNCSREIVIGRDRITAITMELDTNFSANCSGAFVHFGDKNGTYTRRFCGVYPKETFHFHGSELMISICALPGTTRFVNISATIAHKGRLTIAGKPAELSETHGALRQNNTLVYQTEDFDIHIWHIQTKMDRNIHFEWHLPLPLPDVKYQEGFLIVKEGPSLDVPGTCIWRWTMKRDFPLLPWLTKDLSERIDVLRFSGALQVNYFELVVVFGTRRDYNGSSFTASYASRSPLVQTNSCQLCYIEFLEIGPRTICKSPRENEKIKYARTYSISNTLGWVYKTMYCKWTLTAMEFSYVKLHIEKFTAIDGQNCNYRGFAIIDVETNTTHGPFCKFNELSYVSSGRQLSIVLYQTRGFATINLASSTNAFLTGTVTNTACRGVMNSLYGHGNPRDDRCLRIQHYANATASPYTSQLLANSTNFPCYQTRVYGPSKKCRERVPEVEVIETDSGLVTYRSSWNRTCKGLPAFWFVELQSVLQSQCSFTQVMSAAMNITLAGPKCGQVLVNIGSGTYVFFVLISVHKQGQCNTTLSQRNDALENTYFQLNFTLINMTKCEYFEMKVIEDVLTPAEYASDEKFLSRWGSTRELASLCNKNSRNYIINTVRSDKIVLFTKASFQLNQVTNRAIMNYKLKTRNYDFLKDPNCAEGSLFYNQGCYSFEEIMNSKGQPRCSWNEARVFCEKKNASLVSITSEAEMDAMRDFMATVWARRIFSHRKYMIYIGLIDFKKTGRNKWIDGNPVVFAEWFDPVTPDEAPFSSITPWVTQPYLDPIYPCTIMFPRQPRTWSNWAKIPCDYTPFDISVGFICEKRITASLNSSTSTNSGSSVIEEDGRDSLSVSPLSCPFGWTYYKGACLRLYSSKAKVFLANHASDTCKSLNDGGRIWVYAGEDLHTLLRYWLYWVEYGDIWVAKNTSNPVNLTSECLKIHVEGHGDGLRATLNSSYCDAKDIHHVICETKVQMNTNSGCSNSQTRCNDGTCISHDRVCDGVHDCQDGTDELENTCNQITFKCKDGKGSIPYSRFCDYVPDCDDGSDEFCQHPRCFRMQFQCSNKQCIPLDKVCNFQQDCLDGSDEKDALCEWTHRCEEHGGFLCYAGWCLPSSRVNDLYPDCQGRFQEDEHSPVASTPNISSGNFCDGQDNNGRCVIGKQACFSRSQSCVYDTDKYGAVYGCRNLAHLKRCEDFECPGMFKCPQTYCIPHKNVCDGRWDCPEGHDELRCSNYTCPGLLRCDNGGQNCIDQEHVCDGKRDCQGRGDDEKFCDVLPCPAGCTCIGYVILCLSTNHTAFPIITKQARYVNMKGNLIGAVNNIDGFYNLGRLDLSFNNIRHIRDYTFRSLINLHHLSLAGNEMKVLGSQMFHGLTSLVTLDISYNHLQTIDEKSFLAMGELKSLILKDNDLRIVSRNIFAPMTKLQQLQTDAYRFCCLATKVSNCTPTADEFSSCTDLLANTTLQAAIWILGILAFLGNSFVIAWRCVREKPNATSILIVNLGLADFLMGVYLLIIASVDVYYRGRYIFYDASWRSSVLCRVAGFLSMLSSEVSVITILVIVIDRCVIVLMPFKAARYRLKERAAKALCIFSWVVCMALSGLPLFNIPYFHGFYGGNGVCLPFTLSTSIIEGWEYPTAIFIIFNFLAFLAIAIGYIAIFFHVRQTRQNSKREPDDAEVKLAARLTFIVFTDFLCWVPIVILSILALSGVPLAPEVSAWVSVFILPLNSALNPLLYTITAVKLCTKVKMRNRTHNHSTHSTYL